MRRRLFLAQAMRATGIGLLTRVLPASRRRPTAAGPILDAHVHLFDPTRAGGVPWPEPTDAIYRQTLPERLRAMAAPLGVVGAIAIEASPLVTDNDWLLDVVTRDRFMVGMIGDLVPGSPNFGKDLERLRRSPLFLGVRYGNLWKHDLAAEWRRPEVMRDLRLLAEAKLTFETANPDQALLEAVLGIAQSLPELRVVLDHVPHMPVPEDAAAHARYLATLREMAQAPHVFVKLSEVLAPRPGEVQTRSDPYRAVLDPLWEMFGGSGRMLFGSDWPNSDHVATYGETLQVAEDYVRGKGPAAMKGVFWEASRRAYRWQARLPEQAGGL